MTIVATVEEGSRSATIRLDTDGWPVTFDDGTDSEYGMDLTLDAVKSAVRTTFRGIQIPIRRPGAMD